MEFKKSELIEMYRRMYLIRHFEIKTKELFAASSIPGFVHLYAGEEVTLKDLFYLSLVGSANTATRALVNSTSMDEVEFIKKMNTKVMDMGLEDTHFVDSIGLSDNNVSTAVEVAKLANKALKNKYIQEAVLTRQYKFTTLAGRERQVDNTNILLDMYSEDKIKIMGGKTGYKASAGYCFVGKFIDAEGNVIVSAVLGGPSKNSRFHETRNLTNWAYDSYEWKNFN